MPKWYVGMMGFHGASSALGIMEHVVKHIVTSFLQRIEGMVKSQSGNERQSKDKVEDNLPCLPDGLAKQL